ncbi:hypothetical protein DMC30DRAFT_446386 [Rhodotorula diobovata]|uniref:DUF7704 domain-containing protein n=1 Tax=Rhodotorula diobovata TaxID=5288 RepID=A0A5C5FW94_9BASI|nr:hypothetical protein DMC30DRAFT_446386 [Rhodotorula diobovata]
MDLLAMPRLSVPSHPFPRPYFVFFAGVEPFLTIIGAAKAVIWPAHFHSTLIPTSLAPPLVPKAAHAATVMAVRQLGNTYGLLALVAAVVLPTMRRTLADKPADLEACLRAYLGCLAFADVTHIALTLFDLGLEGAVHPFTHWNQLVWGNVGITTCLFVVRSLWFLGIGRSSARKDRTE